LNSTGLFFEFRGGYIVQPCGAGNWFAAPFFDLRKVVIAVVPLFEIYLIHFVLALAIIASVLLGTTLLTWFLAVVFLFMPGKFISIRIGHWAMYWGAKGFGVDSEQYKNWLPPESVYEGSQAIMGLSARMSLSPDK
jgi:hypothetical protein